MTDATGVSQPQPTSEVLDDDDTLEKETHVKPWIAAAAIALGLGVAAPAAATPPLRDVFDVEGSFPDDALSEACGVPVEIGITGTFSITVFRDRDGQTIREIDTQPGTKLTYSSGDASIAFPFSGVLHADYTDGAVVGSTATIALTGNVGPFGDLPGPGSGRLVLSAVVVETEDGFVFTRFTGLRSASGNFTGQADRICAALT